ncbi:uncharacterized protein LOC142356313, partial [Convolutriloba macropyga]|uniref:uncharacterized protein LOC142356313 n=1 Tax=Convolutriloba macropyga TaxID=536237 RepID=UPI003F527F0C
KGAGIPKADDLIQECRAAREHAYQLREKLKLKPSPTSTKDTIKTPKPATDGTVGDSSPATDKYPELKLYRGLPKEKSDKPEEHKSAFTRVENKREAIQRRIELMKIMDSNGEILDTLMDPSNRDYNSLYSI